MTLTRETATTFERKSQAHVDILALAAKARGCACIAYKSFFTYKRWKAQGFQVQKGEHGIGLTTYIPIVKKTDDGMEKIVGKRPRRITVFCACQVKEIR